MKTYLVTKKGLKPAYNEINKIALNLRHDTPFDFYETVKYVSEGYTKDKKYKIYWGRGENQGECDQLYQNRSIKTCNNCN